MRGLVGRLGGVPNGGSRMLVELYVSLGSFLSFWAVFFTPSGSERVLALPCYELCLPFDWHR